MLENDGVAFWGVETHVSLQSVPEGKKHGHGGRTQAEARVAGVVNEGVVAPTHLRVDRDLLKPGVVFERIATNDIRRVGNQTAAGGQLVPIVDSGVAIEHNPDCVREKFRNSVVAFTSEPVQLSEF